MFYFIFVEIAVAGYDAIHSWEEVAMMANLPEYFV